MKSQIDCMDGGVTALDIESMARYWSQDVENYGNIISFCGKRCLLIPAECWIWAAARGTLIAV